MRWSANHLLAAAAGLLACGALVAGDSGGKLSAPGDARTVDAVQLATWIRDRRPGLRVLDLRSQESYEQYHIPGAEHSASPGDPAGAIVVYVNSERYTLRGGLDAWLANIMNPRLPANATREQQELYERQKSLAEYFGGQPLRFDEETNTPGSREEEIRKLRRRTC
jgi:hypothetical protein